MKPKITLSEWAVRYFAKPPNIRTLRRWARNGKIYPKPIKAGREYVCCPDAQYVDYSHQAPITLNVEPGTLSERAREILINGAS